MTTQAQIMREALEFYANPETYFAIMCIGDAPCGDFINDYSDDHGHPQLDGPRYGKRARAALAAAAEVEERQHEHFFINGICSHCGKAAAEVGEPETSHAPMVCPDCGIVHSWPSNQCSTCAVKLVPLAAAAEAGKWKATAQENARLVLAERNAELVERLNSTIERCAQVIRDYNGSLMDSTRKNLIAAICTLKDRP